MEWGHWDFKTNPQAGDEADLPLIFSSYTGTTKEGHDIDVTIAAPFLIPLEVLDEIGRVVEAKLNPEIDRILKNYLEGR